MRPRRHYVRLAVGAAGVLILTVAAAARVLASRGDLWLDEIWSLSLAASVETPLDILTRIHLDNNHPLNTLCMWLLGPRENWSVYRIPVVIAGVAAVAVSGLIGRRRGSADALTAMLLTGSSYLLIHYSSEARGYGPVILFALLALYLMENYLTGRRWVAWLFCPVVVLGLLSHLTFVHAYAGLAAWSLARFVRDRHGWRSVTADVARCHLVPVAFLLVLYFVQIRYLAIGGGPDRKLFDVILTAATLTLGAPETRPFAAIAGAAVLLVFCWGLVILWRERAGLWLFYAIVIVVSPALFIVARPPEFIAVRYFLVSVAFVVLLLSHLLARLYRQGPRARVAYCVLLALLVFGNGVYTLDLIREGRGSYSAAVRYMAEHTPGNRVTVRSDHDFRNRMTLAFYRRCLGRDQQLDYVAQGTWRRESPTWLITHSFDPTFRAPEALRSQSGDTYALVRSYGYARLSGCQWFLYRKTRE